VVCNGRRERFIDFVPPGSYLAAGAPHPSLVLEFFSFLCFTLTFLRNPYYFSVSFFLFYPYSRLFAFFFLFFPIHRISYYTVATHHPVCDSRGWGVAGGVLPVYFQKRKECLPNIIIIIINVYHHPFIHLNLGLISTLAIAKHRYSTVPTHLLIPPLHTKASHLFHHPRLDLLSPPSLHHQTHKHIHNGPHPGIFSRRSRFRLAAYNTTTTTTTTRDTVHLRRAIARPAHNCSSPVQLSCLLYDTEARIITCASET